jgi:hypothetical protein
MIFPALDSGTELQTGILRDAEGAAMAAVQADVEADVQADVQASAQTSLQATGAIYLHSS